MARLGAGSITLVVTLVLAWRAVAGIRQETAVLLLPGRPPLLTALTADAARRMKMSLGRDLPLYEAARACVPRGSVLAVNVPRRPELGDVVLIWRLSSLLFPTRVGQQHQIQELFKAEPERAGEVFYVLNLDAGWPAGDARWTLLQQGERFTLWRGRMGGL